jgi:hypothetical protein
VVIWVSTCCICRTEGVVLKSAILPPFLLRAFTRWSGLVLVALLAGCSTASGRLTSGTWSTERPRPGALSAPVRPARFLLAMNDGSPSRGDSSGPVVQGYDVPGRNPDSQMPWELFLGHASHRLIAYMYGVEHPDNRVYYNTETLVFILEDAMVGDASRLRPNERNLRPDILDISRRTLFEIKPWSDQGLQEGRQEARLYLDALNRAIQASRPFIGGTEFRGEVLIRFARGQYIWRLEWRTSEPGVVQYRWTRSQERFESEAAAYEDGWWVQLTEQEMQQYGGWIGQAIEGMVRRREQLATFSGALGIFIDIVGQAATGFFSGVILDRMGSSPGSQLPPAQGGGQVIAFPARTPSALPPARTPATAGTSLSR